MSRLFSKIKSVLQLEYKDEAEEEEYNRLRQVVVKEFFKVNFLFSVFLTFSLSIYSWSAVFSLFRSHGAIFQLIFTHNAT